MAKGKLNGNDVEFRLEKGDPENGEIAITGILSSRSGDLVSGATILFFVNSATVGEQDTDENGRALYMVPMKDITFTVSGQVRGTAITERVQVPVKINLGVAVKGFDARIVMVSEERGLVRVSIRVTPAKRVHFRITGQDGVVREGDTDEHGFALYPPDGVEPLHHTKQMKYVVEVEGLEKQEEFPLEAPPVHPLPPPPPDGLGFFRRCCWRLRHNNNWRLLFAWMFLFLWLFGNVYFFDMGGDDVSVEWLKYQGMSDAEKFFYESWHTRDGIPLPVELGTVDMFWNWLGSWSWWLWMWWLLASIVYIPIAFWDELSRAWYKARKTVLERREGISRGGGETIAVPAGAEVAPVGERRYGGRRSFFTETVMETLHEIVAEVAVHGISRRFR